MNTNERGRYIVALPPDADPDVSFDLSCGTVYLTRMKKHNRFTAIRRGG